MKAFHKSVIIFLFGATATAALIAFIYVTYADSPPPRPKRRRKPFTSRSYNSSTDLQIRPCCIVAPISPTKAANSHISLYNSRRSANENENDTSRLDENRSVAAADVSPRPVRDSDTPNTVSSYSSPDNNDTHHVSPSECGSSTCSESNSDTSLHEKNKDRFSTPMKPLSEEEFNELLATPVVTPLHKDVRMSRSCGSTPLKKDTSVVREYQPSVVDSWHDKIYGSYHDIVPSLQPYTKPVFPSKDNSFIKKDNSFIKEDRLFIMT